MAARNDITGDLLTTKTPTDLYRSGWDRIFGNKKDSEKSEGSVDISTSEVSGINLTRKGTDNGN